MTGPRPLGHSIPAVAGKALGKRGLAFGALLTDWPSVIGRELADKATPERLAFPARSRENAVLHIRVAGAAALDVQHDEQRILERINGFFGYRAVARLKLIQAPPARLPRRAPRPSRHLDPRETAGIDAQTARIDDPEMRALLQRFGRAILSRSSSSP